MTKRMYFLIRFENLKGEMDIMTGPSGPLQIPGHRRTPSGISNISLESVSSTSTLESRIPAEDDEVKWHYSSETIQGKV